MMNPTHDLAARDIALAWRTCLGGWKPQTPITLIAGSLSDPAWQEWLETTWRPVLLPAAASVHEAAISGHANLLAARDRQVSGNLSAFHSAGSQRVGRAFCERFSRTTGDKVWRGYLNLLDNKRAAGHMIVCVASRAARFHFSPSMAALLLLAVETHGTGIPFTSPQFADLMDGAMADMPEQFLKTA
jgi:hypothetical protein